MSTNVKKSNRTSAKKIVLVGVFGAISTVLMLLSFNVPFIPTFVKLDFSDYQCYWVDIFLDHCTEV